ncbi:MAG: hypothetical protein ACOXZ4_00815 [Sphaerochaetaceae bacterium]
MNTLFLRRAMIGVSPAFFFSLFSTDFTPQDYIEGISRLQALGFDAYQLEIYHQSSLHTWEDQAATVASHAQRKGLQASQFVAHFLLESTADSESLVSDVGLQEMERVCSLLSISLNALLLLSHWPLLP